MSWNPSQIDGPIPNDNGEYQLNIDPMLMCEELEPYRVPPPKPETPSRVWAGQETVFLRFASEAEARGSVLGNHWAG